MLSRYACVCVSSPAHWIELVQRMVEDTKPERLGPYLDKLKKYVDGVAGAWAELDVKVTDRYNTYVAIRERLGLPAATGLETKIEKWHVTVKDHTRPIHMILDDYHPVTLDDFDVFTRYLVEIHTLGKVRLVDK